MANIRKMQNIAEDKVLVINKMAQLIKVAIGGKKSDINITKI